MNQKGEENKMNNSNEINNGKGTTSILPIFNRKRRHTFAVDLKIERVVSLPYASGKFFFKIRLLDGGNHVYTCQERFEVHENKVEFNLTDHFSVKMTSRIDNFTLDHCRCRISIRKEGRGGRTYEKIGYHDLDLASVAGSGDEPKACLLNGYQQTNNSPANAYLEIRMKLTVLEGDPIFKRPDSNHPYINIEQCPSNKNLHDTFTDQNSITTNYSGSELHPLTSTNLKGHSRQASKSSMCSNKSTTSVNSANNTNLNEKNNFRHILYESRHLHNSHSDPNMLNNTRQCSDEESNQSRQHVKKRRSPFPGQFGDIQRRLHSTRIDATEIVNSVMNNNAKTVQNPNGYLCLMYNEDGTARVGSSSSCQSLQSPSSLFVST